MVELAYSDERAEAFRAYMCLYGYKAAIDRCDWVAARRWFYEKEGERSRATARRALFCVAFATAYMVLHISMPQLVEEVPRPLRNVMDSAEIWDANTPIWMDAASTLATARNISVARIITSRRSSMSKEQATEKWVVEVRRAHALEHRPGNWCCVAQCDDGQTAITVADALQNFMRTGLIGDDFHTRTRLVGEKGA